MKIRYSAIIIMMMILLSICTLVQTALLPTENLSEDSVSVGTNTTNESVMLDEEIQPDVQLTMMHFSPSVSSDDGIYYVCRRGMDTVAYFGVSQVYYCVDDVMFSVEFPGSNDVVPVGEEPTGSVTNYLLGNDPESWRTGLADCSILKYHEIYPGIDLVYKIQDGNIKYEFVVQPNADPSVILMRYSDAGSIDIHEDSVSVLKCGQTIQDTGLWAYQNGDELDDVSCIFHGQDEFSVSFSVEKYDHSQELVIDPAICLAYSTFLGGAFYEYGGAIVIENGLAYITGRTSSYDFPTVNAYNSAVNNGGDCFVTKFDIDGQSLIYSTFLGGSNLDSACAIAVENGYVFVSGYTASSDFPTANAYDSTFNGFYDCFVTKFEANGQSLVYSTFLGGTENDGEGMVAIAVENGYAFVTAHTTSSDFPTANAYDSTFNGLSDCFVTKLSPDGLSLIFSTYLGGVMNDRGYDIAVEDGYVYITGDTDYSDFPTFNAYNSISNGAMDCFVTKFAIDGQSLVYSTFLGGSGNDLISAIAVERGFIYITGRTYSSDFPTFNAYDSTFNGAVDSFVTKFAIDGQSLVYSTFLGGSGDELEPAIAVKDGYVYITGQTNSPDFPTANAYDFTYNGNADCYVTNFAADGQSLVYSTFLGGADDDYGNAIAVDSGCAYITGKTYSSDFPTANAYDSTFNGGSDGFISILSQDSDSDGVLDWDEARYGTNPFCIDTDNDNFLDAYEIAYGSNATDPLSYPAMPQAWYDAIYEDLDGNATLIQNLISWSDGNTTLLQTVMEQLNTNATLLQQVISWLDGNHTAIETLFTYIDGNAALLMQTINALNGNATLLQYVVSWLDGNHTEIETLFTYVQGNATLLLQTVNALDGNATLIQNLISWSDGNATLLQAVIEQSGVNTTLLQQIITWLDGNHTAIETLFTYVQGNATLLMQIIDTVNDNSNELTLLAALVTQNSELLATLNATHIDDIDEIYAILDALGVTVGDTDYDGLDDLQELMLGTDFQCIDTDCDNLNDAYEVKIGTDPTDDDSDNDTYLDGAEVLAGTDPLNPNDYPGHMSSTTTPTTEQPMGNDMLVIAGIVGVMAIIVLAAVRRRSSSRNY